MYAMVFAPRQLTLRSSTRTYETSTGRIGEKLWAFRLSVRMEIWGLRLLLQEDRINLVVDAAAPAATIFHFTIPEETILIYMFVTPLHRVRLSQLFTRISIAVGQRPAGTISLLPRLAALQNRSVLESFLVLNSKPMS